MQPVAEPKRRAVRKIDAMELYDTAFAAHDFALQSLPGGQWVVVYTKVEAVAGQFGVGAASVR
eukprot:10584941-Lingulodinium_polyedra.AAC.1